MSTSQSPETPRPILGIFHAADTAPRPGDREIGLGLGLGLERRQANPLRQSDTTGDDGAPATIDSGKDT